MPVSPQLEAEAVEEYRRLTPKSSAYWDKLSRYTPTGYLSARGLLPYPDFIDHSQGAYLRDLDGRMLLDFFCAHSGAILGHNNAAIREAVRAEVDRGFTFGLVRSDRELEVAQQLVERIPSLEKVRFSPTGSETTMRALRIARAFTGRDRIAKTHGGYHGNADIVWYGADTAHVQSPGTLKLAPGISTHVPEDVVLLPFNHSQQAVDLIAANAASLAAIIVEPVLGTSVPATAEYLQALRDAATRHGIVLIFDEMICLGASRGGVQALRGVTPDLTTAGKTVGHGLPFAFYGGRADIMDVTGKGPDREPPQVIHGSTYQRHSLSLVAAAAALKQQDDALFTRMQATGERLRGGLRALAAERGWPVQVTGMAHMWSCHFSDTPIVDYVSAQKQSHRPRPLVELMLLNRGFQSGLSGVVTGAHTDADIAAFLDAFAQVLEIVGIEASAS